MFVRNPGGDCQHLCVRWVVRAGHKWLIDAQLAVHPSLTAAVVAGINAPIDAGTAPAGLGLVGGQLMFADVVRLKTALEVVEQAVVESAVVRRPVEPEEAQFDLG